MKTFTEAGTERLLRDFAAEKEMKAGALINGRARRADRPGSRSQPVRRHDDTGERTHGRSPESDTGTRRPSDDARGLIQQSVAPAPRPPKSVRRQTVSFPIRCDRMFIPSQTRNIETDEVAKERGSNYARFQKLHATNIPSPPEVSVSSPPPALSKIRRTAVHYLLHRRPAGPTRGSTRCRPESLSVGARSTGRLVCRSRNARSCPPAACGFAR